MCTSTHSGQETVDLNGVRSILSKFSFACSSPGCSSPAETVNVLKSHRTQDLGKVHKKYDNSRYIYIHVCICIYIYNYTYTLAHEHIPQTSNQATVRVQNYPSTAKWSAFFRSSWGFPLRWFPTRKVLVTRCHQTWPPLITGSELEQLHQPSGKLLRTTLFTSLRDGNRPHRIVTAQWCRPLRPKTSESTDCRKKNAKNLIAMYSGPTQFKNNEKHETTAKLMLFTVFLRGEKQKPLQIPWFLRVRWPKTLYIYSVFLTNVKKHWYLRCFHSHRNIEQRNLRGFWKFWS